MSVGSPHSVHCRWPSPSSRPVSTLRPGSWDPVGRGFQEAAGPCRPDLWFVPWFRSADGMWWRGPGLLRRPWGAAAAGLTQLLGLLALGSMWRRSRPGWGLHGCFVTVPTCSLGSQRGAVLPRRVKPATQGGVPAYPISTAVVCDPQTTAARKGVYSVFMALKGHRVGCLEGHLRYSKTFFVRR